MEVVLQWFDELDDLVFAGFSFWPGLSRFFLSVAFTTAIAIPLLSRFGVGADTLFTLLSVSLVALSAWGILAVLAIGADRSAAGSA